MPATNGHAVEPDFIQDFLELTDGATSPLLYRKWCAISLIAGACERRVWVKSGRWITYPNLYVLLVGPPGTGKYIIEEARQLWRDTKEPGSALRAFHVAPDSMTKASLVDTLARAKSSRLGPKGPPIVSHSLLIGAEEFQVLLPTYDMEFIGTLNRLYNNPLGHEEVRRTGSVRELTIDNPQLNILGGAQPSYFVSTFPEEAWTTGFARRIIMVYAAEPPVVSLYHDWDIEPAIRVRVLAKLGKVAALCGQCLWHPEAIAKLDAWHMGGQEPVPSHSKLAHYKRSRVMMAIKLAIVSAVARTSGLVIEPLDIDRALAWLFEAEAVMPDIFREMIGRSDSQVLEEMHLHLFALWARDRKPFHTSAMANFLAFRVPSEKVPRIIEVAEKANMIARVAGTGDQWMPRPKSSHGME